VRSRLILDLGSGGVRATGRLGGRLKAKGSTYWGWAVGILALFLVHCAATVPTQGLLPDALAPGYGIALDSADRASARALGRAARAIDAGRLAAGEWELALARSSDSLAGYRRFEHARLRAAQGEYAGAMEEVTELRRTRPPDFPLSVFVAELAGDCLAALGDEGAAREEWARALAASEDPARRRRIGLALVESRQRSGELDPAQDPEELWISIYGAASTSTSTSTPTPTPTSTPTQDPEKPGWVSPLDRGDALMDAGRSAQAIEAYREALAGELEAEALGRAQFQLGVALFRLREYTEALATFAGLGADPQARFWYARSLARTGRISEAIEAFEALTPETAPPKISIRARYLAATLLEDEDAGARAKALYAGIASDPDFPEQAQQALWRIGWLAWRAGDVREARGHFQRMAQREPDVVGALKPRYWAARAAGALGETRQARQELLTLAQEWPLSYYGWRAQQRLGEDQLVASSEAVAVPKKLTEALDSARLERAALLLEAGYLGSVEAELKPLLGRPCALADCVRLGSLLVGIGDYHRAQRLVVGTYPELLGRGLRPGYEGLFWLAWPPAYADFVRGSLPASNRVDPALVWAIMREESGFRPAVMSSAGAMGLLQLMPETARRTAARVGADPLEDSEMLFVPRTNIALGSAYLDYLAERFPHQTSAVIAGYNAGPNAVAGWRKGPAGKLEDDVWVEEIPYAQTRSYVRRVLRSLHVYRGFY
jgi:soluble lytic murein transglycosylase